MNVRPLRVLFVPVSSPRGSGEYARSLSIATVLSEALPSVSCHFALSEEAPYARDCPFPATLMPSSPTFHSGRVRALIERFEPSVVIFDNAGRTAQLQAARSAGARVIFISSRSRQRRRAYRLHWLRLVDEHWIAYPQFVAGSPSPWERAKAALLRRPVARYLDCLIPELASSARPATLGNGLSSDGHVLILTGGVADHPDFAEAPRAMAQAAVRLAAQDVPVVLVGASPESIPARLPHNMTLLPRLAVTEVSAHVRAARVVICNGGDTLFQVLALERACVAVAMAPDQKIRLARCKSKGLDLLTNIDVASIVQRTRWFWDDPARRQDQIASIRRLSIANAMDTALERIRHLANEPQGARPRVKNAIEESSL